MRAMRPLVPLAVATLIVAALAVVASPAAAFPLRNPQIQFCCVPLWVDFQGFEESYDCPALLSQQLDDEAWSSNVSGNSEFDLMLKLPNGGPDEIGVYNTDDATPTLFRVFPGAAQAGWYATLKFKAPDSLIVRLFDQDTNDQGRWRYGGVNARKFNFYLHRVGPPAVTYYGQDFRNPGQKPQILCYPGTGINAGDYWICFENSEFDLAQCATSDFADELMLVQSVNPVGVRPTTWGGLKSLYR